MATYVLIPRHEKQTGITFVHFYLCQCCLCDAVVASQLPSQTLTDPLLMEETALPLLLWAMLTNEWKPLCLWFSQSGRLSFFAFSILSCSCCVSPLLCFSTPPLSSSFSHQEFFSPIFMALRRGRGHASSVVEVLFQQNLIDTWACSLRMTKCHLQRMHRKVRVVNVFLHEGLSKDAAI